MAGQRSGLHQCWLIIAIWWWKYVFNSSGRHVQFNCRTWLIWLIILIEILIEQLVDSFDWYIDWLIQLPDQLFDWFQVISYPEPTIPLPPTPVVIQPGSSRPPMLRSKTVSPSSASSPTKPTNEIVTRPISLNPPQNSRPPPPYSKLQRRDTCPEQDNGDFWDDDWDDDDDDDDDASSTATTPVRKDTVWM